MSRKGTYTGTAVFGLLAIAEARGFLRDLALVHDLKLETNVSREGFLLRRITYKFSGDETGLREVDTAIQLRSEHSNQC